jgi:hypothetical protein
MGIEEEKSFSMSKVFPSSKCQVMIKRSMAALTYNCTKGGEEVMVFND